MSQHASGIDQYTCEQPALVCSNLLAVTLAFTDDHTYRIIATYSSCKDGLTFGILNSRYPNAHTQQHAILACDHLLLYCR